MLAETVTRCSGWDPHPARFTFVVPEQLDGYLGERLAIGSYNYRLFRISANVVGSAVIDCRFAARPSECYADGNVTYDLFQHGVVTLENYERELESFFVGPGAIRSARAVAAERFLTNPLSSADRALLTDYQRAEWWGRPLSGVYSIVVRGRPEIRWANLDDLQVLLEYDYWTRQD